MDSLSRFRPLDFPCLLDERSRPDFRTVYGQLCTRSTGLDVALTRIRLSTIDLGEHETARLERLRLLLAEVNAVSLDVEAHALLLDGSRSGPLRRLGAELARGTIEVRAAPLGGWSPDYSVFSAAEGPLAAMVGSHWFQRPFPHRGPALATVLGPADARHVASRFDETWARAHDVRPAILGILERARLLPDLQAAEPPEGRAAQRIRAASDPAPEG